MAVLPEVKAAIEPQPDIAREFLATIGQVHLVAIFPDGQLNDRFFDIDVDGAVKWAADMNKRGYGIYWTCNAVRPGFKIKPGKADIAFARFAHSDIDPKPGVPFDKSEVLASLDALPCSPSFVIDSGGGLQPFWRLDEPCENWEQIEDINIGICDLLGGDHCWSIEHLVRVPGFVNYPNKKKRANGRVETLSQMAQFDDGVVYQPHVLAAAYPVLRDRTHKSKTSKGKGVIAVANAARVQFLTAHDIGADDYLTGLIEGPIPERYGNDRSKWGLAVAGQMAREGYLDADIVGILINPANACSAHFIDAPDTQRAVARAIGEVRKAYPEPTVVDVDAFIENMKRKAASKRAASQKNTGLPQTKFTVPKGKPGWLRDLGDGPMAEFIDHVCETAIYPQPNITLGAALGVFGTAGGRRYISPSRIMSNIYTIGLLDSGGGKEAPLDGAKDLIVEAGLDHYLAGSSIASGAAILSALEHSPTCLFTVDEIGFLFETAKSGKQSAPHLLDISAKLTELYNKSGILPGKAYADRKEKPTVRIIMPCLSLIGMSTPQRFWGAFNGMNAVDGSLARFLVFESDCNYPLPQIQTSISEMPERVVSCIQQLAAVSPYSKSQARDLSDTNPYPLHVPYAEGVVELVTELTLEERQLKILAEGTGLNSVNARITQNALKIALIRSISENPDAPSISKDCLRWGWDISTQSAQCIKDRISDSISDNEYEMNSKLVERVIRDAGPVGVTTSDFYESVSRKMSLTRRDEILRSLESAGRIVSQRLPGKGRPAYRYFFVA